MAWRNAYEFYRRRRGRIYACLWRDPLSRRFIAFVRWRLRRSLFPEYAPSPHPES